MFELDWGENVLHLIRQTGLFLSIEGKGDTPGQQDIQRVPRKTETQKTCCFIKSFNEQLSSIILSCGF